MTTASLEPSSAELLSFARANELHEFLENAYLQYSGRFFIETDPVSIPHRFSKKQDIEISGFLTAVIAWGQRSVIIKNALRLMEWMEYDPHRFILDFTRKDLTPFRKFAHRTFNGRDCCSFLVALQALYRKKSSLEDYFMPDLNVANPVMAIRISTFRRHFFQVKHEERSEKHLSDPLHGSAAKRMNMFLRWMVRKDATGVDFGIWKKISPKQLMLPLDIHSGTVARSLGLLNRKQNDWKAVEEVTARLRCFDESDPVKYDYALFGTGAFGGKLMPEQGFTQAAHRSAERINWRIAR